MTQTSNFGRLVGLKSYWEYIQERMKEQMKQQVWQLFEELLYKGEQKNECAITGGEKLHAVRRMFYFFHEKKYSMLDDAKDPAEMEKLVRQKKNCSAMSVEWGERGWLKSTA